MKSNSAKISSKRNSAESPGIESGQAELERRGLTLGAGGNAIGFSDKYAAAIPLSYAASSEKLNHNVFRYPAKFHPPIARQLIELFSRKGDTVLDPFCGSGTLLVEASVIGRHSVGTDIDPLAVFVSKAKTSLLNKSIIEDAADSCSAWVVTAQEADKADWGNFEVDISEEQFQSLRGTLDSYIPELPNIFHWFRRRAILQLAAIRKHISENYNGEGRLFLQLCYAAIIRNSSNADPIPISGLEVTSHMLAKERAGRTINPWALMLKAIRKSLAATLSYIDARAANTCVDVSIADARTLRRDNLAPAIHSAITSPPYLTAVDYYRRHTLEMYWLGMTSVRTERLDLMAKYIGRDRIAENAFRQDTAAKSDVADHWIKRFPGIRPDRERAFRHYCDGMARTLRNVASAIDASGPVVVVVGDVRFCGTQVSMLELMRDLARDHLTVAEHYWYPIINRYMSYARRNDASIAADHVIAFRRHR